MAQGIGDTTVFSNLMGKNRALIKDGSVTLKTLAEHLELSPATVSLVLNQSSGDTPIPAETRKRILAAAQELGYRAPAPLKGNKKRRSFSVGIVVPELSEGYFTLVMNGVEEYLFRAGYLHFVVSHQRRADLLSEYPNLLMKRDVDGLILVNTTLPFEAGVPTVTISGHKKIKGVTNVMLDHDQAAWLALKHLYELGHRRICFMKGQHHAEDSESRWQGILQKAKSIGLTVYPELCVYLHENSWTPELGYPVIRDLLERTKDFTAIFCFNDTAAIGAIRALKDAGLSCPEDVSVIGFDDIAAAAYHIPRLTTVRQPLKRMGELAAQVLLTRIQNPDDSYSDTLVIQPELVVRESTGPAPVVKRPARKTAKTRK